MTAVKQADRGHLSRKVRKILDTTVRGCVNFVGDVVAVDNVSMGSIKALYR